MPISFKHFHLYNPKPMQISLNITTPQKQKRPTRTERETPLTPGPRGNWNRRPLACPLLFLYVLRRPCTSCLTFLGEWSDNVGTGSLDVAALLSLACFFPGEFAGGCWRGCRGCLSMVDFCTKMVYCSLWNLDFVMFNCIFMFSMKNNIC